MRKETHDFLRGEIIPIIKDRGGDASSSQNYRGITLSSIFAQMFEIALRLKFGYFLRSSELQFGFKPGMSTSHAMFSLKNCINYFTSRGSNVFTAFLDLTKAFDTISHYGLFIKLMERQVPLCFLLIIMYWYMNMSVSCKWGGAKSESFEVTNGTKQGGVLSPDLFAIYLDELLVRLKASGVGCRIAEMFLACILFADDMTLAAPSRSALQKLINVAVAYCEEYCLNFNAKKTKIIVFGPKYKEVGAFARVKIGDTDIDYVDSWRYLGFYLKIGIECCFCPENELKSFFRASNGILTTLSKPNEAVLMHILYSNCVSILTYGSEVKEFTKRDFMTCNTSVNNAIRKIFSYKHYESIRTLREQFGYLSLTELFAKSKKRFHNSLSNSTNSVLCKLCEVVCQ